MRRALSVVLAVAALCICGCGAQSELGARYRIEKRYYDARQLERQAYATYPVDDYPGWQIAVDAYRHVLRSNPARIPESSDWDPARVAEMERVALAAEIGLLRLEALDYRYHRAVSHPYAAPTAAPLLFGRPVLRRVQVLYDSLGPDPIGERCHRRLRAVVSDPMLWRDTALLRDSLLAVPVDLLARGQDAAGFAEGFYTRVISAWPDSAAAARSRGYRAVVRIARGDSVGALEDAAAAAERHPERRRREEFILLQCDLLAFHLERPAEAVAILRRAVERDPGGRLAWWARTRLALLEPPAGVTTEERLRTIYMDDRAPADIAAAAMYARATILSQDGELQEAENLYWLLTQRFPDSEAALSAPLRVVEAELAVGRHEDALRAHARARGLYLDVIRRGSAAVDPRFLPLDCIIEAGMAAGVPAREGLERALESASGDGQVVARIKLAALASYRLDNPQIGVEILEKALVLDPGSRYARCVRWILQRTREARDDRQ